MVAFEELEGPQRLAALAHDRNYAVTAGAGSGKTTTFASRYLKLLERTEADPQSIAAITFTESGATELEERVRESVSDRLDDLDGEVFDRWREYHDALPEAYVHTIHGFCSRLLREYALEADVPVGFDVVDETAARGLQRRSVQQFVAERLDDPRIERLTELYYRDRLETLLADLLEEHHRARQWADEWADREPGEYLAFVVERYSSIDVDEARAILQRDAVRDALRDLQCVAAEESAGGNRIGIATAVADAVDVHGVEVAEPDGGAEPAEPDGEDSSEPDDRTKPPALEDVEVHDAVVAICQALTSDGTPYYGDWDSWCYDGHDDWDDENARRYEAATSALVEAFPVEEWAAADSLGVDRNAAPYYVALASLFRDLHEEYEERKREETVLDFADLIDGAIELLRTTPDVREDLRETFDHVMLDEVQDTDPRQWELVELLTSLDDAYDGLNVFVVGDEKQSIFRFRGADVTQYRAERERLDRANERADVPPLDAVYDAAVDTREKDGEAAALSRNFRSLPGVLEPINDLFDELFGEVPEAHRDAPPGIDGDDASFEPAPQPLTPDRTDPEGVGSGTTMVVVPEGQEARDAALPDEHPLRDVPEDGAQLDARALAAEVASFLDGDPKRYRRVDGAAADAEADGSTADAEADGAPADAETDGSAAGADADGTPADAAADGSPADDGAPAEQPTDLEPADVAILLRKRTHLEAYERALAELNVPYTVASGLGFYDSTEIVALRNLFAVLRSPSDDLALFGVLRSPLFGFDDETVVGLWEGIDRDDLGDGGLWRALETTDDDRLATARDCIAEWRRLAGVGDSPTVVETWDALLGRIVEDTGFLASLALDERGQQAVANVEKFRARLRAWSEDGLQTLPAVVDRLEREVELSSREGEAAVPEDADGVRITTVHDAKGREFPAVFVPGLSTDFNLRPGYGEGIAEFETVEDPVTGDRTPLLGIRGPDVGDPFEQVDTTLKRRLAFLRKREAVAEEKRILYVAATRARDHLRLVGTVRCDGESLAELESGDPDDPSSCFDLVGPALFDDEVIAALAEHGSATALGGAQPVTIRLPEAGVELAERGEREPPELELEVPAAASEPEYSVAASYLGSLLEEDAPGDVVVDHTGTIVSYRPPSDTARGDGGTAVADSSYLPRNVFGDVVHKLVELDVDPDDRTAVRRLAEQFAAQHDVDAGRVGERDVDDIQRHARTALAYLERFEGATVVDEKAVTATLESGEVYGDIDRLVVTEDAYHVVDYKTNATTDSAAIEAKADYYAWQLRAYAVALHQADPERSVRATLLFTEAGRPETVEWTPDELERLATELDDEVRRALGDSL